jgi:hypothetical protein
MSDHKREEVDNAFLNKANSELNSLLKKTVKLAPHQGVENVEGKVARWGRLLSGDCEMDNATLTMLSNGVAHFTSVVFTNHTYSGDHWWTSFEFRDANNVVLGSEPWHEGPTMDDGDGGPPPHYNFDFDFNFDPAIFAPLANVVQGYSC